MSVTSFSLNCTLQITLIYLKLLNYFGPVMRNFVCYASVAGAGPKSSNCQALFSLPGRVSLFKLWGSDSQLRTAASFVNGFSLPPRGPCDFSISPSRLSC